MSTQEKLDKLFDGWKKKHKKEFEKDKEGIYKKTEEYYKAFASDGLIGKNNQWDSLAKDKNKVLYILVEPNWAADKEIKDDYFWFQDVVYSNGKDGDKQLKGGQLLYNLAIAQCLLEPKDYKPEDFDLNDFKLRDFRPKEDDFESLKNAAYMNLKKRGGGAARIDKNLDDYIKHYHKEIIEEIEEMNPDIIVCCGKSIDKKLKDWLGKSKISSKIISCYHPSYRGGYESFFNNLKENYDAWLKNKKKVIRSVCN